MVGDVAAFVASIYMRGIPVVQVPTTLLAQVDSSIGGKTAVNHRVAKNLIGTFHQPAACVSDPTLLKTLPEREYLSGLYEAMKYGVITERKLFEEFQSWISIPSARVRSGSRVAGCVVRRSRRMLLWQTRRRRSAPYIEFWPHGWACDRNGREVSDQTW